MAEQFEEVTLWFPSTIGQRCKKCHSCFLDERQDYFLVIQDEDGTLGIAQLKNGDSLKELCSDKSFEEIESFLINECDNIVTFEGMIKACDKLRKQFRNNPDELVNVVSRFFILSHISEILLNKSLHTKKWIDLGLRFGIIKKIEDKPIEA